MAEISDKRKRNLQLDKFSEDRIPKWVIPSIAGSWFVGLIALFWVYAYTDITLLETLKYQLFFSVFFTLIPYKLMVKLIPVDHIIMLLINVLGLGPLLTSSFLLLNFFMATNPTTYTATISSVKYGKGFNAANTVIKLQDNELDKTPKFRTFDSANRMEIIDSEYYQYTISQGLFGFDVLLDHEFIIKED